jgi:hypothetical protein
MDHGELEWDFPPETPPILPITPDINTTDSTTTPSAIQERHSSVGVLTHPFIIRWFQMGLDDYYRLSDIYTGATFLPPNYNSLWEDPVQIIFFFM